ncbi:MAG TPA: 3-isopropylmalate dehydratase small subunit [Stellaceae bacterium]|nr:3-isopropylmalate dehydratase small subunit [Stellaceae bacterium]
MEPLITVKGAAAAMPVPHIDTDVIMPKQFLKGIDREGLGQKAFFDQRFDEQRRPRPEFILNQAPWADVRFLVVGPNFGCGSSREHAVWGLMQMGVRALIGTSFAGIFNDNCQRNGLLTVTLRPKEIAGLTEYAGDPKRNVLALDLAAQTITAEVAGAVYRFEIDKRRKDALMLGLDAIGETLQDAGSIRDFEKGRRAAYPWL